ncbi:MAG: protein kinase domain-containing protein [Nannocystaceae bacterium]|nr:protein kinase [bacterium]
MEKTDPRVEHADGDRPATSKTLPGRPAPSTVDTLAVSPDALDELFKAPAAPAPPKGVPHLGSTSPVLHPAQTNVERRPSALDTLAAPPVRPSALATMVATPVATPRPSVVDTMAQTPQDDPLATREAPPASVLDADPQTPSAQTPVTQTMTRGSGPAASTSGRERSAPPLLAEGKRPVEAPEGVDRNLALARLQERMLGVEPEAVKIGRFVVIRKLGQGAMGIVYLAYDPKLDRKVALKLVDTSALGSEMGDAQTRLEREAQAAAALGHPNVVTVYDVGEHRGDVFLAMEFVEGSCLTDWIKERHGWRDVTALFLEIARGLAAAHDADMVHRDFKPDNVLLGVDGRPRVADFGLARPTEGWSARDASKMLGDGSEASIRALKLQSHDALASTGEVCGTPAYMAPEQFAGVDVGPASDQFGFCVSLFEALFGFRPFKGDSVTELAVAVLENDRQTLPARHDVPKAIVEVVLQGLEPKVEDRHPSMHALADRLDAALRVRMRNRLLAGGALVAALSVGFGAQAAEALDEQPCDEASSAVDRAWSSERKDAVTSALHAANLSTDITTALDAFAEDWTQMRVDSCEAALVAGRDSTDVLDLRTACLDRARSRLDVAADALANAPTADRVRAVPTALGSLAECEDVNALRELSLVYGAEDSLESQAAWVDAERKVAFIRLHQYEPPTAWSQTAAELESLGETHALPHAVAIGAYWQGRAMLANGDVDDAEAALQRALPSAALSLSRTVTPRTLYALAEAAIHGERYAEASERLRLAEAMSQQIREPQTQRETLDDIRVSQAHVAIKRGAPEQAAQQLRAMLEEDRARPPRFQERVHSTLGAACRELGDTPCALEHHAKALELVAALPEVEPLELAGRHANMGLMHADMGNAPEATAALGTAAEIVEQAFDAKHPMRGQLLSDRGGIQGAMGDPADGERDLLEGLAIHAHNHGKDHPALVEALIDLNRTQLRLGKLQDATKHGEWALRIVDAAFEGQHPRRADPRLPLADAYAATGRFDDAARVLREGLEILDTPKTHPMQRAEFQFALARALAPNDAEAAAAAAREAKAFIADFEPGKPLRDAIDGWTAQVLEGTAAEAQPTAP